ncbi:T9SS type A sorting domain-containing protein [Tamlana crocina]
MLEYLYCHNNKLTDLDLSGAAKLKVLSCYLNDISVLDLSAAPSLRALSCGSNALTALNVKNGNNANFTYFDARNNPELSCIEVDNASYSTSNWPNKDSGTGYSNDCEGGSSPGLTYVPNNNFEQALIDLGHDDVLDDYVVTANISGVTTLNVSDRGISDMTGIEDFVSLVTLSCGSNGLGVLDLSGNALLEYLYCHNNKLTDLDLSGAAKLKVLSCYLNDISVLDLSAAPSLRALSCGSNALTALNVKNGNNANFTYFDARNNPELSCIEVDNASYSTSNWPNKDSGTGYSNDCVVSNKVSQKKQSDDNALLSMNQVEKKDYKLYPNPVEDVLNIVLNNGLLLKQVKGYSAYGQLVFVEKKLSLDLNTLVKGIYFIEIETNKGIFTEKIMVK